MSQPSSTDRRFVERRRHVVTLLIVMLTAALSACTAAEPEVLEWFCGSDADCDPGFACSEGRCRCTGDNVCAVDEYCNVSGSCQKKIGCETNLDCPAAMFCDRRSGHCLDGPRCTDDVHCPLGSLCDLRRFSCVEGCRASGDCPLGGLCACPSGAPRCDAAVESCGPGTEACELGQCVEGPCADNSYCRFGEVCAAPADGGPRRCRRDERGPYCEACSIVPGIPFGLCGADLRNFCLVDTSRDYGSSYCGVWCESDAECPWGFDCSDVLILTQETCTRPSDDEATATQVDTDTATDEATDTDEGNGLKPVGGGCRSRAELPCASDADCPGGECDPESARCRSICLVGEGDRQGFCTCLADTDCPGDLCFAGQCAVSRAACAEDADCGLVHCKNVVQPRTGRSVGYCFIGRNCGPVEGVTCDEVNAAAFGDAATDTGTAP